LPVSGGGLKSQQVGAPKFWAIDSARHFGAAQTVSLGMSQLGLKSD
jgi:hypothetical protein